MGSSVFSYTQNGLRSGQVRFPLVPFEAFVSIEGGLPSFNAIWLAQKCLDGMVIVRLLSSS